MHTNSQAPSPATTIAERLSGGEPYIITFGGQATPWRQTLADLVLERTSDLTETFFVGRRLVPFPPGGLGHATAQRIAAYMRWEDRRFDAAV